MNRTLPTLLMLAGLIGCAVPPPAPKDPRSDRIAFSIHDAEVAAIEDGDTMTLRKSGASLSVRLSDFDAPETFHLGKAKRDEPPSPSRPGQRGGIAARESLEELAPLDSPAKADCYEVDVYGRLVCHVFVKGVNVNIEQLRRGWGMTPRNPHWIRDAQSPIAEAKARVDRVGVWRFRQPIHPSDWRKNCWEKGDCTELQE